jgi:hypothetical protein
MIWVAYNEAGDLVADGDTLDEVIRAVETAGYYESEVAIFQVSP